MIIAGEFRDTDRVTESDLAKRLSVSRTPVREALLRLEGEGLVFAQGRGVRMRYLSRPELIEVFEARAALEGLSAELAAQRQADGLLLPADLRALGELAVQTDEATRSGSLDDAIELNRAFHRKIAVLGGNEVVVRLLDSLWDQIVVSTRDGLETSERAAQVHREHEALIASITNGAPEQSRVIARDHVLSTQRILSSPQPALEG